MAGFGIFRRIGFIRGKNIEKTKSKLGKQLEDVETREFFAKRAGKKLGLTEEQIGELVKRKLPTTGGKSEFLISQLMSNALEQQKGEIKFKWGSALVKNKGVLDAFSEYFKTFDTEKKKIESGEMPAKYVDNFEGIKAKFGAHSEFLNRFITANTSTEASVTETVGELKKFKETMDKFKDAQEGFKIENNVIGELETAHSNIMKKYAQDIHDAALAGFKGKLGKSMLPRLAKAMADIHQLNAEVEFKKGLITTDTPEEDIKKGIVGELDLGKTEADIKDELNTVIKERNGLLNETTFNEAEMKKLNDKIKGYNSLAALKKIDLKFEEPEVIEEVIPKPVNPDLVTKFITNHKDLLDKLAVSDSHSDVASFVLEKLKIDESNLESRKVDIENKLKEIIVAQLAGPSTKSPTIEELKDRLKQFKESHRVLQEDLFNKVYEFDFKTIEASIQKSIFELTIDELSYDIIKDNVKIKELKNAGVTDTDIVNFVKTNAELDKVDLTNFKDAVGEILVKLNIKLNEKIKELKLAGNPPSSGSKNENKPIEQKEVIEGLTQAIKENEDIQSAMSKTEKYFEAIPDILKQVDVKDQANALEILKEMYKDEILDYNASSTTEPGITKEKLMKVMSWKDTEWRPFVDLVKNFEGATPEGMGIIHDVIYDSKYKNELISDNRLEHRKVLAEIFFRLLNNNQTKDDIAPGLNDAVEKIKDMDSETLEQFNKFIVTVDWTPTMDEAVKLIEAFEKNYTTTDHKWTNPYINEFLDMVLANWGVYNLPKIDDLNKFLKNVAGSKEEADAKIEFIKAHFEAGGGPSVIVRTQMGAKTAAPVDMTAAKLASIFGIRERDAEEILKSETDVVKKIGDIAKDFTYGFRRERGVNKKVEKPYERLRDIVECVEQNSPAAESVLSELFAAFWMISEGNRGTFKDLVKHKLGVGGSPPPMNEVNNTINLLVEADRVGLGDTGTNKEFSNLVNLEPKLQEELLSEATHKKIVGIADGDIDLIKTLQANLFRLVIDNPTLTAPQLLKKIAEKPAANLDIKTALKTFSADAKEWNKGKTITDTIKESINRTFNFLIQEFNQKISESGDQITDDELHKINANFFGEMDAFLEARENVEEMDWDAAIEAYKRVTNFYGDKEKAWGNAVAWVNIGYITFKKHEGKLIEANLDEAIGYCNKAIELIGDIDNKLKAEFYNQRAGLYLSSLKEDNSLAIILAIGDWEEAIRLAKGEGGMEKEIKKYEKMIEDAQDKSKKGGGHYIPPLISPVKKETKTTAPKAITKEEAKESADTLLAKLPTIVKKWEEESMGLKLGTAPFESLRKEFIAEINKLLNTSNLTEESILQKRNEIEDKKNQLIKKAKEKQKKAAKTVVDIDTLGNIEIIEGARKIAENQELITAIQEFRDKFTGGVKGTIDSVLKNNLGQILKLEGIETVNKVSERIVEKLKNADKNTIQKELTSLRDQLKSEIV